MKSLLQTMIWLSIRSGVVIAAVVLLRLGAEVDAALFVGNCGAEPAFALPHRIAAFADAAECREPG